jgi:hypothetical protein
MNVVYTARQMKRRYEVWFLRCGLADGRGAWWLRYLLLNLGRGGAARNHRPNLCKFGLPGSRAKASRRHSSKAIPPRALQLSSRRQLPFHLRIAESGIEEGTCWGEPQGGRARDFVEAAVSLAVRRGAERQGWIGFSKSPHSNALFSGEIHLTAGLFPGRPSASACKDTTADTATARTGAGCTRIFPGRRAPSVRWRRWFTTCLSALCFAKRCCGTRVRPRL